MVLAAELGMRPLVRHCGRVYRRAGKRPQALEHLGAAAAMFRELQMLRWLEAAGSELQSR